MSIYADNPLLRGHAHIRLLRIRSTSGSPTDEIKCTFTTFDITAVPRYQALSYEWGPKSPSKQIYVFDQPTTVRLNLWSFLSRLRSHGYDGYLWCDAICIDQGNNFERNHQVQLMNQIYRKAHSVLVWLGEENHNSGATLRTIRLLSESVSGVTYLTGRATVWKGLAALSRRRYWTRVWIVQEITMARDLELFCGDEKVPWSAFATACKFPPDQLTSWASRLWIPLAVGDDEKQTMRRSAGHEVHHSIMYGLIRSQRRWPIFIESLTTLSMRYKRSGCEDSRDRIFALLSIAKESMVRGNGGFKVDYQKDMEQTFISIVAWAGTGPIPIASRVKFARVVADVLNLKWPNYSLESRIQSNTHRSPTFDKWIRQHLIIAIRCQYLGKWTFSQVHKRYLGKAEISPRVFRSEPVAVYLSFHALEPPLDYNFYLFALNTSNVLLACNSFGTVIARAYYQFHGQKIPDREFIPSIFEGLNVRREVGDETGHHVIELSNVAQFIEVLLDELDPGVWQVSANPPGLSQGGGSLPKVKKTTEDRDLKVVLKGLKITNSMTLTEEDERGDPEESGEDESLEADCERRQGESEVLARPRIRKPPIEKPRSQKSNALPGISKVDRFLDPFCERPLLADDSGGSSASSPIHMLSLLTPTHFDFAQPIQMPYIFPPVSFGVD